jgi:hypothetical protein
MLVFIDESGDSGFKLLRGSTPIFAAAMAIFGGEEEAIGQAKLYAMPRGKYPGHPPMGAPPGPRREGEM